MTLLIEHPSTVSEEIAAPVVPEPAAELESWPAMQWPNRPVRISPPSRRELWKLRVLIIAAAASLAALLVWLLNPLRVGDPAVYVGLTAAVVLRAICWLFEWYNYWSISIPKELRPRRKWSVDVFTTACPGEPHGMIVRTLKAMTAIRYPHTNYLCDEGNDPHLKRVCRDLGVVHVTRTEKKNAKAGNINNALARATGQIAVVLDPDHEPSPYLLERTLGYFEDPTVGFVQSVQAYRNQKDSFIARGAAEQSYHFYGPYMMGMHGHGTTQAIGANCVFRRAALDSIGGHAAGLAEDMHTAMRIYSKGWRSVYLPEILTRGLVPSTLAAYYKQQIKWACGVFDLLFQQYPSLFRGFTLKQKIHYLICPIFFLRGLIGLLELVVPVICLAYGLIAWRATLPQIAMWLLPVIGFATLVRLRVQRWLLEPHERGLHVAGGLLATATWWVYLVGFLCACFRIKVPYIPTPKEDKPVDAGDITLPNFITAGALIVAAAIGVYRDSSPPALLMAFLAGINATALIYVSLVAQQVTMQMWWDRLAGARTALRPAKKLIRFCRLAYRGLLHQVREGFALPGLLTLAVAAVYLGVVLHPHPTDTETPFELNKDIDVGGFYTGLDIGHLSDSQRLGRIAALEKQLDFHFRIVSLDQTWGDGAAFPLETLKQLRRDGAVPMINWLPDIDESTLAMASDDAAAATPILRSIAEGDFDQYIGQFANQVRAFGEPVLICFAPRPDDPAKPWSPSGGNSANDFIEAWRHIVKIFDAAGATNAGWVWNPAKIENLNSYFPGEAGEGYVDWIALSVEGSAESRADFDQMYQPLRDKVADWHLPIMLDDFGASGPGRAPWLQTAMSDIGARHPEIKAVVFKDDAQANSARDGVTDVSTSAAASIAPLSALASIGPGLKYEPFNTGGARPPGPDQPLWFDLHPKIKLPRYISGGAGRFELNIDGAPFYIKGIAFNPGHDWRDADVPLSRRELDESFTAIARMGANTIRRYGKTFSDRNIFNAAEDHSLKVLYGFWFFQDVNYITNTEKKNAYQRQIEGTVLQYRDHPALLGWSLGNEVWGLLKHTYGQPYLTQVRHAHVLFVEKMARRIKELDPNHPVFCMQESKQIAGAISDYAVGAPSVDVIGVNSYYEADIAHLDRSITRIDTSRPYVVSEFGPDGYWEDVRNHYDRQHGLLEDTAMNKAWDYARRWRKYIQANAGDNIGGVAYCWSDRYEGTATWFGMTDLDGRPKPACTALQTAWYFSDPALNGDFPYSGPKILNVVYPTTPQWPGEPFVVKAEVDVHGKNPRFLWSVTGPGFNTDVGRVRPIGNGESAQIELPAVAGWYRVQLKVLTDGGMDEANVPVLLKVTETDDISNLGATNLDPRLRQ